MVATSDDDFWNLPFYSVAVYFGYVFVVRGGRNAHGYLKGIHALVQTQNQSRFFGLCWKLLERITRVPCYLAVNVMRACFCFYDMTIAFCLYTAVLQRHAVNTPINFQKGSFFLEANIFD